MTVRGFDVSHHQAAVSFPQAKAAGYSFCHLKATEGTGFVDPKYATRKELAEKAGLLVGSYHFGHPKNDPGAEVAHYLSVAGHHDLPFCLDIEVTDGQDPGHIKAWATEFVGHLGHHAWLYSGDAFARTNLKGVPGTRWIARYSVLRPAGDWDVWQHSSGAHIPGATGRIDVSKYPGSLVQFEELCGIAPPLDPTRWGVVNDEDIAESNKRLTKKGCANIYAFAHNRTDPATGHRYSGRTLAKLNRNPGHFHPYALTHGQKVRLK